MFCPMCGQEMSIPSRDAQPVPPVYPQYEHATVRYAGFWIRFVSVIVDWLVLLIPGFIANIVLPFMGGTILWIVYKSLCLANWDGQTVGKKVCNIKSGRRVSRTLDARPGLRTIVRRNRPRNHPVYRLHHGRLRRAQAVATRQDGGNVSYLCLVRRRPYPGIRANAPAPAGRGMPGRRVRPTHLTFGNRPAQESGRPR